MNDIILASSSPRRIELLQSCFINFECVNHSFNEKSISFKNPKILAEQIALGKALSVACKKEYCEKYVIGVDTIVVYKNKILGKPENKAEAQDFIKMLSGKQHRVISGIALINIDKDIRIVKNAVSKVIFNEISDDFFKFFLDNNHWLGYAGGYAIQGIFSLVIKKIIGSYTNIVGLPMEVLYMMLKKAEYMLFKK